jgi:hypothetical protein
MKFTTALISAVFVASSIAAPSQQPIVVVTRDDGSKTNVGGSVGCFGTDGNLVAADITPGFEAVFYNEYACSGQVLSTATGHVDFHYPINTKSIKLNQIYYQ